MGGVLGRLLLGLAISGAGLGALVPTAARADVSSVVGSAFGYSCVATALGQFSCAPAGPTPSVTLASDASNSPQSASVPSASATAGPATFFSSGSITVSTQGSLGPGGSVTSTATIQDVNSSGDEVFTASTVSDSCTALEDSVSGSATITDGTLMTDNGDDDPDNGIADHPAVVVPLSANPAPNTTLAGHVHVGNETDNWQYVFNEQTLNGDGSLVVNAAHQYFIGPLVFGDLLIGQVRCGVTPVVYAGSRALRIDLPRAPAAGLRRLSGRADGSTGPVRLTLVRRRAGSCRVFDGRRWRRGSCDSRISFAARGRRNWSFKLTRALAHGRYRLTAVAPASGADLRRTVHFTVRRR